MDESLPYRVCYSIGTEKCKKCRHKIEKSYLQVAIMIQSNEDDSQYPIWYHQQCFFKARLPPTEAAFDGFALLRYDHQLAIKKDLGIGNIDMEFDKMTADEIVASDFSVEYTEVVELDNGSIHDTRDENTMALQKEIRFQNDEYFNVYDYIKKSVPEDEQIQILDFNKQIIPDTDEQIAHHLADVICFGALKSCSKCKRGKLLFRNWVYKCTNGTDWTTCGNEEKDPPRYRAKFSQEMLAKHKFLEQQCRVQKRALHAFKFVDEQGNDLVYGPYKNPPLFNMEFVLIGTFKQPTVSIKRLIKQLGGKVSAEIHDRVAAIISTPDEVRKMDIQMKEAQECNIQVVTEDFLDEIQAPDADPILYIISNSISDWGGDPYERIEEDDVPIQREPDFYTKSLPEKMTHKWKDGGVVDPECGLEENSHVYSAVISNRKVFYSVILGLVDIERNKNSYYRMQLLESIDQNLYWVFESWGRTGTVVCSKRLKIYGKLNEALEKFNTVYQDKTGNKFGSKTFKKQPKKFYHLDIEVGMPSQVADKFIATKLDAPVFDLMQMMFDVKTMENLMCGCDLDLKQMPLGKISAKQIKMAMLTLVHISNLIRNGGIHELRDASSKFYTLIPHAFGIGRPPIIDSIQTIRAENEKLESLLNMQIIYSFLEGENGEKSHPLDGCYRKLNATIVPIAKDSTEFQLFCNIVQNTHGPTHNNYTLEVLEIFNVVRDGEDDCFQQQLSNHKLLWHGSRLSNFVKILSNGLKIAPPEALATGYMFGKGIYFADVVTKSANYCLPDRNNTVGLVLLCEVALGQTKVMTDAFNFVDIPNAQHQSVEALGRHVMSRHTRIDGVVTPLQGFCISKTPKTLQYNEYVVYDTNQVKIKYLFKMKFNFKN